jgi:hypothetical protein
VKKSELAHILRAASEVTNDPAILVIGSQAILASFDEDELPKDAIRSIEADVAFLEDPDERKSDAVDGAIGEESLFHETFGVYGQGVSISTATLPSGWEERLVAFDSPEAGGSKAVCLDAHDLVVSKLVAGREKDFEFAQVLLAVRLIDANTLLARAELLPGPPAIRDRVIKSIRRAASRQ